MNPAQLPNDIVAGMTWRQAEQWTADGMLIVSSTDATPSSLNVPQHGLTTGDRVMIGGCAQNAAINTTEDNPAWTVTVTDADNFTLNDSVGTGNSQNSGYVGKVADSSSATVYGFITSDFSSNVALIYFSSETTPTSPVANRFSFSDSTPRGTFEWIDRTSNYYVFNLTSEETAAYALNKRDSIVPLYVVYVDADGNISEPIVYKVTVRG